MYYVSKNYLKAGHRNTALIYIITASQMEGAYLFPIYILMLASKTVEISMYKSPQC